MSPQKTAAVFYPKHIERGRSNLVFSPLSPSAKPTSTVIRTRTGGINHEYGIPHCFTVQAINGSLAFGYRRHFNKAKSPRLPGILVGNNFC